jgi:hypothetical protein
MSIVLLTSAGGAPGVTTTALGLSAAWGQGCLLADCEREPTQSVLAGHLGGADPTGYGLPALATAHREGQPLGTTLLRATMPLPARADGPPRWFLPGFAGITASDHFTPVWPPLMEAFHEAGRGGVDVVIDAGPIGRHGLPPALVQRSDVVGVCCRTNLRSLARLRLYLPVLGASLTDAGTQLGLVLIGPGRPYGSREIAAQFEVPVIAEIAFDERAAAVLSDGEVPPRRYAESPFSRSLTAAASRISAILAQRLGAVGGGAS